MVIFAHKVGKLSIEAKLMSPVTMGDLTFSVLPWSRDDRFCQIIPTNFYETETFENIAI